MIVQVLTYIKFIYFYTFILKVLCETHTLILTLGHLTWMRTTWEAQESNRKHKVHCHWSYPWCCVSYMTTPSFIINQKGSQHDNYLHKYNTFPRMLIVRRLQHKKTVNSKNSIAGVKSVTCQILIHFLSLMDNKSEDSTDKIDINAWW